MRRMTSRVTRMMMLTTMTPLVSAQTAREMHVGVGHTTGRRRRAGARGRDRRAWRTRAGIIPRWTRG